jgi:GNAT superfamily N-acetyltransferase
MMVGMPEISDRAAIRALLAADPGWCLYALGDLAPGYFERSSWYGTESALLLVYRAVTPPVLFATGDPAGLAGLIGEVAEPAVYFHVRPEAADAIAWRYHGVHLKPMARMVLDPSKFRPECGELCFRLGKSDVPRLEQLYEDGREAGESPDFFFAPMVENGVFFGVYEGAELVAAAGTHLAEPGEGVAAIGNVYTRRDRRGCGLAGTLTTAVTMELMSMGVRTIGMNVSRSNAAALRVYERLGFFRYCDFLEGPAALVTPA